MNMNPKSVAEKIAPIIELNKHRKRGSVAGAASGCVTAMVEIACDGAIGAVIKSCLTRHLEESGYVTVSDDRPDWVFSIIAFHYESLVEMSVVLRRLFRSTAPGTEMVKAGGADREMLRKGGWVYESLRYHGLHGVPETALEDFLKRLAKEFASQHLGILPKNLKMRT